MNEFMLRDKITMISEQIDQINRGCELENLKRQNQVLQDFMIWTIGFLDGNVSKRGEGKV